MVWVVERTTVRPNPVQGLDLTLPAPAKKPHVASIVARVNPVDV